MTNMTAPSAPRTSETAPANPRPQPRDRLGAITVVSLATGLASALVLTLVAFPGAREPVITGAGLVGLSVGWAPASTWSDLPEPSASVFRAYATSPRAMTNAVDEVSQYAAAFSQAQALTSFGTRPLVVLTLADKARSDSDGWAAQERFAALSSNSSLRTADTTHIGLVDQEGGASSSVRAIADVVGAVRAGTLVSQG